MLYWIDSSFSLNELTKAWSYRASPASRCVRMRALYIVISVDLGNKLRSLRWRSSVLLTLANTLLRWSSNIYLESNMTPSCFRGKLHEILLLLKTKGGWVDLLDLRLKVNSWACLFGSGLKLIFHWKAHSLTFFKSSFNSFYRSAYIVNNWK